MTGVPSPGRSAVWAWRVVGVLLFAFLLMVLGAGELPYIAGDGSQYLRLVTNLVQGHGYSLSTGPPYEPTAIRVPGYPLFLLVTTLGLKLPLWTAVLAQVTLQVAMGALLAWVLVSAGVGGPIAAGAALAAVLLPPLPHAGLTLLTESVATALGVVAASVAALAFLRDEGDPGAVAWPRWLLAGSAVGLGGLVRPEVLLLGAFLAPLPALTRGPAVRRLLRSAVLVAGVGVPLLPWAARNYVQLDRVVLTAAVWDWVPRGYAAWVQTWMDHPRYVQGAYWDVWPFGRYDPEAFPDKAFADDGERALVDSLLTDVSGPALVGSPADSAFGRLARSRVREDPVRSLVSVPLRRIAHVVAYLPTAFAPPDSPLKAGAPGSLAEALEPGRMLLVAAVAANALLFLGGLVGSVWSVVWRIRWALPFAALLAARLVVVGWLIHPEPRYVVEALPAAAVLSALVAHRLVRRFS